MLFIKIKHFSKKNQYLNIHMDLVLSLVPLRTNLNSYCVEKNEGRSAHKGHGDMCLQNNMV